MEPRAYQSGAAGLPPPLLATAVYGYPCEDSPGQAATIPGPYWFYGNGEEVRNVIIDGDQVPDPYDNGQMLKAIRVIAARP